MKRITSTFLAAAVAMTLSACTTTPKGIPELETARAVVPQVEASPRAGVAAANVSEARKALDRANKLAEHGGKLDEVRYEAVTAARHAQIANEKILTAQAKEELNQGTAERQKVLLEARNRETDQARMATDQARMATDQAKLQTAEASRETELARQRANSLEQELKDLQAKKTDRGMVLTLGDVLFDTGKANLKPGAYKTIDSVAKVLKQDGERKVMIEGHTDSLGSDEYNQTLSEHRAQAVQTALLERGVATAQIQAVGRGEAVPIASNDDAGGRQQNRRVEMVFTDAASKTASDQ